MNSQNPTPNIIPRRVNTSGQNVGLRAEIIPTKQYKSKPLTPGAKHPTFRRMPAVSKTVGNVAFTGGGIVPDLFSEGRLTTFPAASATRLERGVMGVEGMLPPYGKLQPLQRGQKLDSGAGGAGSFATGFSHNAKG